MAINFDEIKAQLCRIANQTQQGYLTKCISMWYGDNHADRPPQPDFPFARVESTAVGDSERVAITTEEHGVRYHSIQQLLFTYTIMGGDAAFLAQRLRNVFMSDTVRDSFYKATDATIADVEEIIPSPTIQSDQNPIDIAFFNVVVSAPDSYLELNEGCIETISLGTLTVKNGKQDHTINIDIDTTTPS